MYLATDERRWTQITTLFLICVYLCLSAALLFGEVLDRIAVVVGKHVIAESEVLRDLRVAAFLDQAPLDLSPEKKRKAAARLVDQFLILEEAVFSRFTLPTEVEAEDLLGQVKSQYASDAEYRAALGRYQVSEPEVIEQLLDGLRTSRFTDLRFRPEIQSSDEDLHDFYNTLVDQWKRENRSVIPSFEDSRSTVERILLEQRSMQALDRWLGASRTETRILYREEVFK